MFEEIAYEKANKKFPIPLVSSEVEIVSNYKYGEGFKEGMEFVYTKRKFPKTLQELRICFDSR